MTTYSLACLNLKLFRSELHLCGHFVNLQCFWLRGFGWGPLRREKRSWAWWTPGWGWWICGGWWVCGRTRGPWRIQEIKNTSRIKKNQQQKNTVLLLVNVDVSHGFVLLKIKKALPSGIGVIFSFFTRSEMTGRGPEGTSGSSSSTALSSNSSSSSYKQEYVNSDSAGRLLLSIKYTKWGCTFSSFSSSFLSLEKNIFK